MHMKTWLAVATALLPLAHGFPRIEAHIDEPCKQVQDAAAAWISENGIGKFKSQALKFLPGANQSTT